MMEHGTQDGVNITGEEATTAGSGDDANDGAVKGGTNSTPTAVVSRTMEVAARPSAVTNMGELNSTPKAVSGTIMEVAVPSAVANMGETRKSTPTAVRCLVTSALLLIACRLSLLSLFSLFS